MKDFTPKPAGQIADEIEFKIFGEDIQYVEVYLDPGETVIAEAGSMLYMNSDVELKTCMGTPEGTDLMGKLFKVGKRLLTGESIFLTTFTATGSNKTTVAFAAPYPGTILPMNLRELGGDIICQKDSFVCAAKGVDLDIFLNKKIGTGLFGGEGFILERIRGDGLAFVHAGGTLFGKDLAAGETLRIDTGCIVAYVPSVNYDVQYVGSIKTAIFGGEGLFYATLTGPGKVWLQSLPFSRLAGRIFAAAWQGGGKHKDEGSLLGGVGRLLGGD
ncbi:MAG: TIGR00266 family protein [Candidatus Wallbacteria bacterium]|nr:TIGR00266 family protein [Candidatus Wallbacteria bacterium]